MTVQRRPFHKRQRVRRPVEYQRVYDAGVRAGDGRLLVFAAPNEDDVTRCGTSVSRRHGNAVRRHDLKRRLREAFRLSQHELPTGFDLILIPRPGIDGNVSALRRSLVKLVERLAKKWASRTETPSSEAATR